MSFKITGGGNRHIAVFSISLFYFLINEVKVDMFFYPSQRMILSDPVLKAYSIDKQMFLGGFLMTHHGAYLLAVVRYIVAYRSHKDHFNVYNDEQFRRKGLRMGSGFGQQAVKI